MPAAGLRSGSRRVQGVRCEGGRGYREGARAEGEGRDRASGGDGDGGVCGVPCKGARGGGVVGGLGRSV
jgi:hypothetical protein